MKEQEYLKRKHKKQQKSYWQRYYDSGVWFDKERNLYIKIERRSYSKALKNKCNKKLRRNGKDVANGGNYKKFTEFWYELY